MHHCNIPVSETECDLVQCIDAVYERGTGSESDQGIHIRGSVNQCLKPDTIVFEVDKYDRNQEQKLGKGEDHGIFRAKEDARQRPAYHMSHGKIKQWNREDKGPDHSSFHALIFFFRGNGR